MKTSALHKAILAAAWVAAACTNSQAQTTGRTAVPPPAASAARAAPLPPPVVTRAITPLVAPVITVATVPQPVQIELKKIGVSYAGAPITLRATLKSGGHPLANAKVVFSVAGLPGTNSGTSDATGNAEVSVLPPEDKIGLHGVKAVYEGDASHKSAQAEDTMDVWKTPVDIHDLSASLRHGLVNGKLSEGWDLVVQGTLQRATDKKPIASQPVQIRYAQNGDNHLGSATTQGNGFFIMVVPFDHAPGDYVASVDYLHSAQNAEITKTAKFTVPNPNPVMGYFSQPTVTMPNGAVVGKNAIVNTRLTTAPNGAGSPLSDLELMVCAMKTCVWPRSNAAGWLHATLPIKFGGSHPVDVTWRSLQILDGNNAKKIKFDTVIATPKPAVKIVATVPKGIIDGDHLKFTAQLLLVDSNAPADCYQLQISMKKPNGTWQFLQNDGPCNAYTADPSVPLVKVDFDENLLMNKARPLEVKVSYQQPNGFYLPTEAVVYHVQVQPKNGGGPVSSGPKTVK